MIREIENIAPLQSDFLVDKNDKIIIDFIGKT